MRWTDTRDTAEWVQRRSTTMVLIGGTSIEQRLPLAASYGLDRASANYTGAHLHDGWRSRPRPTQTQALPPNKEAPIHAPCLPQSWAEKSR